MESGPDVFSTPYPFVPRCIRHITSIQIRNLTPFPVRDSFTSALSKPIEKTHLTSGGQIPYVDVVSPKKRLRKLSSTSAAPPSSRRDRTYDDEPQSSERRIKPRSRSSHSRLNMIERPPTISDDRDSLFSSSPTSNLIVRPRTASIISLVPSRLSEFSKEATPLSALLPDTSQSCLEGIISSRLVETFLSINVLSSSCLEIPGRHRNVSAVQNSNMESPRETNKRPASIGRHVKRHQQVPKSSSGDCTPSSDDPIPDYLSPIHIPSTNPVFTIDVRSGHEFPPGIDENEKRLNIKLWGRRCTLMLDESASRFPQSHKGSYRTDNEWLELGSWNVDLDELRELPENSSDCSYLPSNSLLITLSPPGLTFYYPEPSSIPLHSTLHSTGYASDPESRSAEEPMEKAEVSYSLPTFQYKRRGHEQDKTDGTHSQAKTASWQDIFKLVSAQSCVVDTKKSLSGVMEEIGTLLQKDIRFLHRRDISLRESRIQELKLDIFGVLEKSSNLRTQLQSRTARLQQRRNVLQLARKQAGDVYDFKSKTEQSIIDQRHSLILLRSKFGPLRVSLITILSNIFPIELLSPPDLLYTILDVPLPIPTGPTDPAPPLVLPEHKEVSEDSVATAMGYVAQVLRLISTYTGRDLVYPVTCVGSRSLIRDDISAMVGPRMFPLFSVGVDTYRFEYGVFLLNKNIEIIMTERDLRALDMRHTLPNLKNLLLTLSHGQGARLRATMIHDSPLLHARDLDDGSHGQASTLTQTTEERSASHSGSTTPTTPIASGSGKLRLLGLGPFADFLRSRPLSTRAFTNVTRSSTAQEGEEESITDIDEDQKTIHASPREGAASGDQIIQGPPIQLVDAESS